MSKSLKRIMFVPAFNSARQLKSTIANSMWKDANDFNWKADILLKNIPHESKSYFGKVYVDIMMGIESSLKSLIVAMSPKGLTPEQTYINVRSKGHRISDLYNEVQRLARQRVKLLDKKDYDVIAIANQNLSVNNRYDLITFLLHQKQDSLKRILHTDDISLIFNEEFLKKLLIVAIKLASIANRTIKKYCDIQAMSGTNLGKLQKRTDLFYTTLKNSKRL